jgi:hypothetical protein
MFVARASGSMIGRGVWGGDKCETASRCGCPAVTFLASSTPVQPNVVIARFRASILLTIEARWLLFAALDLQSVESATSCLCCRQFSKSHLACFALPAARPTALLGFNPGFLLRSGHRKGSCDCQPTSETGTLFRPRQLHDPSRSCPPSPHRFISVVFQSGLLRLIRRLESVTRREVGGRRLRLRRGRAGRTRLELLSFWWKTKRGSADAWRGGE